jgi:hypothetical protein
VPFAVGAAVLGIGVAFAARRPAEPVIKKETEQGVVSTPGPSAPAAPVKLILTLRAQPSHATLFLDDGPALPNPYQLEVVPDAVRHKLRAVADGYVEQTQDLWFDRSKEVSVALPKAVAADEPTPAKKPVAGRVVRPRGGVPAKPVETTPKPGELPGSTKRPPRQIDVDNPVGRQ